MATVDYEFLRTALKGQPVEVDSVTHLIGEAGVNGLRRQYFPRWRPNQIHVCPPAPTTYRKVVVEDAFEGQLVKAVAPQFMNVEVKLDTGETP
jgi:hypothetical protein